MVGISIAHAHCESFLETDILDSKSWKHIAHQMRCSVRWHAWTEFGISGRHKIQHLHLPEMTIERIEQVRKWSSTCSTRRSFVIGAVKSTLASHYIHGEDFICNQCGTRNPDWDHGWTCLLSRDPPKDTMMRRFLWVQNRDDQLLAQHFIDAVSKFYVMN